MNTDYNPKGGRPTDLTDEIQAKIIGYIRLGAYIETAAVATGIVKQTFFNWLKWGNDARSKLNAGEDGLSKRERRFIQFLDSIEKAQAEAELLDLQTIRASSATNWQAAAWRLERRHPGRWGRRDTVIAEHSGPDGGPIVGIEGGQAAERSKAIADAYKAKLKREVERELGLVPN